MSPLIGIFAITLLSSVLYNKFDANSRATTARTNSYYSFEKSNAKSVRKENLRDEKQGSKFWDEKEEADFAFENISELDVCIFTVVAGNQKFCKEKTDENLGRLTLLMMSCHTASKENKFPKCTSEKTFAECISSLNTANLEMFKNVKKRALTVCQEVSQQLFMINSQRRAQALLETAQLHSSVMTSFKDNQKLLENITSQTLTRLRAQRVAFMKDMRLFKKYFTKNESLLMEATQTHLTLLSRHKEIIGGLEKDVNVLTEGFFQSLDAMQNNFTAFSAKIFEKHREIMANLNRVENTANKILKQLETIEEYDYTVTLKNVFNWIMANLWRSRKMICVVLSSFLIVYGLVLQTKIIKWIKFLLMASVIGGIFFQYEDVGVLIAAWFMSISGEILIWCFSFFTNGRTERVETEINDSVRHSSVSGIQDNKAGETSSESGTSNDSLGHAVPESTRDSSGEHCNIKGGIMGPHRTSVSGLTVSTSSQIVNTTRISSNATENDQPPTTKDNSMAQQDTIKDYEIQSPATEHSGSMMCIEVQTSRGNIVHDRINEIQHGEESSTISDTRECHSTKGDFLVQRGNLDCNVDIDMNAQGLTMAKSVITSTLCDREIQTGPGNDMAVQTSTQRDSEVQTEPSENISVQTNTTVESSAQTNTDKAIGVQTSTRDDTEVQTSISKDILAQTSRKDDTEVQTNTKKNISVQKITKEDNYSQTEQSRSDIQVQTDTINDISVKTSITNHGYSQTEPSDDMGIQRSSRTESDFQVQTDTINNMAIQTSTRGDSSVQTRTSSAMAAQKSIGGDTELQKDTNNNSMMLLQTSTRNDSNVHRSTSSVIEAKNTRSDSQSQTRTVNDTIGQASAEDNMALETRLSSVTGDQTILVGDRNLYTGTSDDIRGQPSHNRNVVLYSNDSTQGHSEITYDFGIPHEPLGMQEGTAKAIPRRSGIIVNIGDNFSNSRRQISSPRTHSRTSSLFEVVTENISGTHEDRSNSTVMNTSGLRRVSQDISGEAGTSGEFSSIQVGEQINRPGSSGRRQECGLMTSKGTPCRRRVSAGRCYIHKYSKQ